MNVEEAVLLLAKLAGRFSELDRGEALSAEDWKLFWQIPEALGLKAAVTKELISQQETQVREKFHVDDK